MELNAQQQKLMDIAEKVSDWIKEEKMKFPYHVNVIHELHDNENAHTRILIQLLRYSDNGRFPILESFIDMLNEACEDSIEIEVKSPTILTQYEYIDGYVSEPGKYAIIIENKIWDAIDQKEQISQYVQIAKKEVTASHIIVVYLTKDGNKEVSENSLTQPTKNELGKRFIPIDYKNHIIPWLRDEVLPNCKIKEEYLRSAIHQYIDYLYEINGMQNYQVKAMDNVKRRLFKELGMESESISYQTISSKLQNVNDLQSILNKEMLKLVNTVVENFVEISIEILKDLVPDSEWVSHSSQNWLQLRKEEWDKLVHLEWIPFNSDRIFTSKEYSIVMHVEGELTKTFGSSLLSNYQDELKKMSDFSGNTTFFKKKITTEKPLGEMSQEEMKKFLLGVYKDDIKRLVDIIDSEWSNKYGLTDSDNRTLNK